MTHTEVALRFNRRKKQPDGSFMVECPTHPDKKSSLHISAGDDGRVMLKCFAGCEATAIIKQADLTWADLFPPTQTAPPPRSREVAYYDYHDPDGALAYQVVRLEPKGFYQRRPGPDGTWINKLDDAPRWVYHVDELAPDTATYWVEGEKDADRLRSLGVQATTSAQGASAWRDAYLDQVPSGPLFVIPDNDEPGYQYATRIATAAYHAGRPVKVLSLPGVLPKGDVSDWLDGAGSVMQLEEIAKATPAWTPATADAPRVERLGDDWRVTFDRYQIALEYSRYKESRQEIHVEFKVFHRGVEIFWRAGYNLNGPLGVKHAGEALKQRTTSTIPWDAVLERSTRELVRSIRTSDPPKPLLFLSSEEDIEQWLVPGFIPLNQATILYGDGGSGKSLVALAVALCIATGHDLTNGLSPDQSGPVLFLDTEADERDHRSRLTRLARGMGITEREIQSRLFYLRLMRPLTDVVYDLRRAVAEKGIKTVVLDSLAPAAGPEPQSADAAIRTFGALRTIPGTHIITAHLSKEAADQQRGTARPFGSAFNWNLCRQAWEMRRADEDQSSLRIGFYDRKHNESPTKTDIQLSATFLNETRTITLSQSNLEDPDLVSRTSLPNRVLVALKVGKKSIGALHEELATEGARGPGEGAIRATLHRLRSIGKVQKFESGKNTAWALASYREAQTSLDGSD